MGAAPPDPQKQKQNVKRFSTHSQVTWIDTHSHAPAAPWLAQGAFEVAHRQPGAGDSLWTTALPE